MRVPKKEEYLELIWRMDKDGTFAGINFCESGFLSKFNMCQIFNDSSESKTNMLAVAYFERDVVKASFDSTNI